MEVTQRSRMSQVYIASMGEMVDWARRGEGSENRHHFPPRDAFSDPSPLRVMSK